MFSAISVTLKECLTGHCESADSMSCEVYAQYSSPAILSTKATNTRMSLAECLAQWKPFMRMLWPHYSDMFNVFCNSGKRQTSLNCFAHCKIISMECVQLFLHKLLIWGFIKMSSTMPNGRKSFFFQSCVLVNVDWKSDKMPQIPFLFNNHLCKSNMGYQIPIHLKYIMPSREVKFQ